MSADVNHVAPSLHPSHESRRAPLQIPAHDFRAAGHELVDSIADFLEALPNRPLCTGETPAQIQEALNAAAALPETGGDTQQLLRQATSLLFEHSLFNGHPKFFGYITASPAHIGILGDFLAAAVNANVGSWRLAPIATEIEAQTVRWIADLIGYPTSCGGILVSGGNMANMAALFAARAAAADWDLRSGGVAAGRRMRVYASTETHTWLQKATDLSGLGTDAIRWIETGDDLRMDVAALRRRLDRDRAAGELPMMIVGTGGSVSTGAIDPLTEIAAVAKEAGVWFHVDGAYGAFAAAAPQATADLRALSLADSVAVDPHKWLYAPLEAGCVLVRDADRLRSAFSYHPPYYHFGREALNYVDFGPQNSRGFRALKVWLALRQVGRAGYRQLISDDIELSERLHSILGGHPEFETFTQSLSITTFRYVPADLRTSADAAAAEPYLNVLNEALLERIQSSGEAFVSNAVIGDRYLLRTCIVNFNTTERDIDELPSIIARLGREVHAALSAGTTQ